MVCPDYLFAEVSNVKADFTHTIHVRKMISPIVNLFYRCVPVIVEVRLKISFALVGHTVNSFLLTVHVFPIEIPTHVTVCH